MDEYADTSVRQVAVKAGLTLALFSSLQFAVDLFARDVRQQHAYLGTRTYKNRKSA